MKVDYRRYVRLSRLREVQTSAGQYAIGFLLACVLFKPTAWLGLLTATAAGVFAFTYNTIMDHRAGQTVEHSGKALGPLSPEDLRISKHLCLGSLGIALVGILLLLKFSERPGGAAFLLFYLLIGFLYSAPEIRWKEKPGLECVSNGLAHALPFFAGYFQFRTPDIPALAYGLSFFFFMCGYYLLHCLEDRESDRKAGIENLCYVLGFERSINTAITLTGLAGLFFLVAVFRLPILFIFLPFYPAVIVAELTLLRKEDLGVIALVRKGGRVYGAVLFVVLFVRALV